MKYITLEKLNTFAVKLWSRISSTFVRKEEGKGLSANDFTATEKNKLAGIAAEANKYIHPSGDGYLHLPETGTSNSGKVLKAGTTAGNALWDNLDKNDIGLGNINNTSDMDKPISAAAQTALNKKADIASPSLTGIPKAPTPEKGTNTTQIATTAFVNTLINESAVTCTEKSVKDNTVSVFDGVSGKAIKSSGFTIGANIPENAKFTDTVYTHPAYTAQKSGLYKITVDEKGHISAAEKVSKNDITGLGIPGQDTNTTYDTATTSANGLMSAIDKARLDELIGIAGEGFYTHPSYTPCGSGLYKITVDSLGHVSGVSPVTKEDITTLGIPGQDTNTTYSLATSSANGLLAASDYGKLNKFSMAEAGYLSGVTSSIQNQLNTKASSSHTHSYAGSSAPGGAAASAVKLQTPKAIGGVAFDGTANILPVKFNCTLIASNTNINNITEPGYYYCAANATAVTCTNCPTSNAFFMTVGKHAGVYQEIVEYVSSAPKRYMRNCYNNTWGSWYRVYTTCDPQTSVSGASGSCTGNAATATKATQDSAGQQINTTYLKGLSVNGRTITYTKGNGTTGTITTQDTNTTYNAATVTTAGLMSAADKVKLDGIAEATETDVDNIIAGTYK